MKKLDINPVREEKRGLFGSALDRLSSLINKSKKK